MAESEQCEQHPDRIQVDTTADEIWRKYVVRQTLADEENRRHDQDMEPIWPELGDRDARRDHQAGERAEIRDEANKPHYEPDQ